MSDLNQVLSAGTAQLGLCADSDQIEAALDYLHLIQRWNRVDNLTRITDPVEMVVAHLLDSLSIAPLLRGERTLDVGSGAGLPGIPLAIMFPNWQFVLLDAAAKRVRFMRQAALSLGLQNVLVEQGRIETLACHTAFDQVVSRAFATLDVFAQAARHCVKPGGHLLAMKGRVPTKELAALDGKMTYTVEPIQVPGLDAERHVIDILPHD